MSSFDFYERPWCELCGSLEKDSFAAINWKSVSFQYVICANCGLVYMDPVPTLESYLRFYKNDFWAIKDGRLEDWQRKKRQNGKQHSIRYQLDVRAPRVNAMVGSLLRSNSRILEIGCGFGETLAYLHNRYGAISFGVEPSDDAVAYISNNHPYIQIIARSAEELISKGDFDGTFDVIILSHCLENILDVNQALATVRRMLADDGHLYIDTPNLYWSGALNPYHPVVFTPDTLAAFLSKHGFQIVQLNAEKKPTVLLTDCLKLRKRWFNLVAIKGALKVEPTKTNAVQIRQAFKVSRQVLALQAKMKRVKHAVIRPVRL